MLGRGALTFGIPPLAVVYHLKLFPAPAVAVSNDGLAPKQYVIEGLATGTTGKSTTLTVISLLGLSHPALDRWLTKYFTVLIAEVIGIGAVLSTSFVAEYQINVLFADAVADKAELLDPTHKLYTVVAVGAAGIAFIVTVIGTRKLSQPEVEIWDT